MKVLIWALYIVIAPNQMDSGYAIRLNSFETLAQCRAAESTIAALSDGQKSDSPGAWRTHCETDSINWPAS